MIDMRSDKSEKRLIAEDLFTLYNDALKSAHPKRTTATKQNRTECKKCGAWFFGSRGFCDSCRSPKKKVVSLEGLDKGSRRAFLVAAALCIDLDADARDFIVAQFAMMQSAGAYHGKALVPTPYQLGTLAAHARYLQYMKREDERLSRTSEREDQDDDQRWFIEERKLRGYARLQRRDPIDVMTEQPEQFSRDFLKHKGVWGVVRDLWDERQRS
jgi:hypothetical protein